VYESYIIYEDDNFGEDSDHKQETKLRFKFASLGASVMIRTVKRLWMNVRSSPPTPSHGAIPKGTWQSSCRSSAEFRCQTTVPCISSKY
jgi:hypothetical protein